MKQTIFLAVFLCSWPHVARADGRVNFRVDFNQARVQGAYKGIGIDWPGLEVELETSFKSPKLIVSGFSLGVRRETFYGFTGFGETKGVHRWDEGTYLSLRTFRTFHLAGEGSWMFSPSVAVLYGIPGTTLDSTVSAPGADGLLEYTHVFPMRNADVPGTLATQADVSRNSAVLYPEVSVSMKKPFVKGGLTLEWVAGVRIIRFGVIDSNAQGAVFNDQRTFVPSLGMRMGIRIF